MEPQKALLQRQWVKLVIGRTCHWKANLLQRQRVRHRMIDPGLDRSCMLAADAGAREGNWRCFLHLHLRTTCKGRGMRYAVRPTRRATAGRSAGVGEWLRRRSGLLNTNLTSRAERRARVSTAHSPPEAFGELTILTVTLPFV